MRKYLAALPHKSPSHKKHFAFAVSSGVTLTIFGFWALVNFGAEDANSKAESAAAAHSVEVSPFQSLKDGVSRQIEGIYGTVGELKQEFSGSVDFKGDYTEMKTGVLNTYDQ